MQKRYLQLMAALDSLMMDLEVRIKICLDVEKDREWHERGIKGDYDLWVVEEGRLGVTIDEKTYILNRHDVILLSPQVMYTACCKSDSCRFAFVHFDASIGKNPRALDGLPLEAAISSELIGEESEKFLECFHTYRAGTPLSALSVRGTFMMLLWKFLKVQLERSAQSRSTSTDMNSLFRIYKVFDYIETNIDKAICVDDLAEIAKMSPKYFITFFKKAVGVSPAQYVLKYRMKKALEYLYEEKYSVKEIAAMVGYEDQYTFSKAFKKIYNSAPSNIIEAEILGVAELKKE